MIKLRRVRETIGEAGFSIYGDVKILEKSRSGKHLFYTLELGPISAVRCWEKTAYTNYNYHHLGEREEESLELLRREIERDKTGDRKMEKRGAGKSLASETSLLSLKLETVTFHLSSHPWTCLVLDYDTSSASLYISWKDTIEDVDGETIFSMRADGKTEKVSIGVKELSDSFWFIDANPVDIFKLLSEFFIQIAWERDSKIKKAIELLLSTLAKAEKQIAE